MCGVCCRYSDSVFLTREGSCNSGSGGGGRNELEAILFGLRTVESRSNNNKDM